MTGFITIERDLWDHPLFKREPMTEREAWIWMISQAAYAGTQHRVGAEVVAVERGSFMVTLRELQSQFMWQSDKRVRNFLQKLENHGMLTVLTLGKRNARKTHVSICNYDEYQSGGRSKDAAKTHRGRTGDAVKKQGNKVTREPKGSQDAGAIEILAQIVPQQLAADFAEHRRQIKKPMTENAAAAMVTKLRGHHDPGAVLTDSIANGWQGIFPEKIRPQFKAIKGGDHDQRNYNTPPHGHTHRPDAALEQIARLTGI